MSRMISLTRIVAINWYGFRDIFEVGDNMLISGAFGTGKSALLDLIQYVLLGGEKQFNRAAAGNARGRDLVGYCLGDTNQPGRDGGRHFFRRSGVTIAALEFTRPDDRGRGEAKRETWGIRLEFSSPDAKPSQTYFCIPERIEYSDLSSDGKTLLTEDAFRTWIRREYRDCIFSLQREYLAEMAAPRHLNFDERAFQRTFPKAIAFEPENNVPQFIREFILEESPLDVRDVRSALRAYEDTRKRLEKQEDEADCLRRIAAQNSRLIDARRREAVLRHIAKSLELRQEEELRDRHQADLQRLETEHEQDLTNLRKAEADSAEAERLLLEVRSKMDIKDYDLEKMEHDKSKLHTHLQLLREAQESVRKQLDDRHYRWSQWLKHGSSLPLDGLAEVLAVDDRQLSELRSGSDFQRLNALFELAKKFQQTQLALKELVQPLDNDIRSLEARLRQLAADLENLGQGRAPGAFPLLQAIRQKLGTKAEQLGRLIEVRPEAERWWSALELFLGRNRWIIVVDDQPSYREALEVLRKTPPTRGEQESLLNPAEVRSLPAESNPNSLFAKVDIAHPIARDYVAHLLGGVECVESIEELETCPSGRAITPEGIFKQAPLRRRLKPSEPVPLTLGSEGLKRMEATLRAEQIEKRAACDALKQRRQDINTWLDNGINGGLGDSSLPDRSGELSRLPEIEVELSRLRETIQLLATPEREARQARLKELEDQKKQALLTVGSLRDSQNTFILRTKPHREALEAAVARIGQGQVQLTLDREELRLRFADVSDSEIAEGADALHREFSKWTECLLQTANRANEAGRGADEARYERNAERERLVAARDAKGQLRHPEYAGEFSTEDESNEAWDARLRVLEEVELSKSRELAADRKREWERRLEESVLNELNSRLQDATNTIRLLDRYLGKPVGKYRYRISQKRDTQGYAAIWRLLDSGLEPTDPLAAAIKEGEIQRAKEELMAAVNASADGDERARRLLDYRNYHHYDIEMVPADHPDAPPISMTRSGRNLSGGENQAPFFISMLAAFRRVYDRGDRASARSQQLGLVVMDEAFSKLSGDGIDDCLALARDFQLQLVMAFPPERLGVMIPHAQTVMMCLPKTEIRDDKGYVTRLSNNAVITTMTEALDALS